MVKSVGPIHESDPATISQDILLVVPVQKVERLKTLSDRWGSCVTYEAPAVVKVVAAKRIIALPGLGGPGSKK